MLGGNIRRAESSFNGGCLCNGRKNFKHGLWNHPAYGVWDGMIRRCYSLKHFAYNRYGGRGISVCDEWRLTPEKFIDWIVSSNWETGLQLDRIDNNKGYYPENCRLVTPVINANNKENNTILSLENKRISIADAAKKYGINKSTIRERIKRGWSDSESVGLTERVNQLSRSNTSGVKGVSLNKLTGRWRAFIKINGKQKHIGVFDLLDDAIKARSDYENRHKS